MTSSRSLSGHGIFGDVNGTEMYRLKRGGVAAKVITTETARLLSDDDNDVRMLARALHRE